MAEESKDNKDNNQPDTSQQQQGQGQQKNFIAKGLDPVGDGLSKGLSPVGNALGTATKPVTHLVEPFTRPVGDVLGMGNSVADDVKRAETETSPGQREKYEQVGGKDQTADNPLGL